MPNGSFIHTEPGAFRTAGAAIFAPSFPLQVAGASQRAHTLPFHRPQPARADSEGPDPGLAPDDLPVFTGAWVGLGEQPSVARLLGAEGRRRASRFSTRTAGLSWRALS